MSETKQSIYVSKGCPLIVSGTGNCREYNYVVLEKGAFIRILDGSKFSIETLTREMPAAEVPISTVGDQSFEQDDSYRGFDIIIAGRDGENGENGGDGGSGNQGGNAGGGGRGKDGLALNQNFDFTVKNLEFDLNIYYGGGKGGDGGNSSGEGLLGGYGGDGGMGGDGGDQSDFTLTVTCSSTSEPASVCKVTNAASMGGKGGQGGIGGSPVPTSGNNGGSRGTDGSKGGKGRVILNGEEVG